MFTEKTKTPRVDRLMLVMGLSIAGTVVTGFVVSTWLFASHHADRLFEEARASAVSQAEVLRAVLEHQMREKDRSLIADLVAAVGRDPAIRQVLVVDHHGVLRYSSRLDVSPEDTRLSSPTCQACHRSPPEERVHSRVVSLGSEEVLRTVTPLRNKPECFQCHGTEHRVNGVLIVDVDARRIPAEVRHDAEAMALWGGGVVVAVLVILGLFLRATLVRRLRLLQSFGARLAAGEIGLRMPVHGRDALSFLAESFNTLADAIARLVGQVREERAHLERILNSIPDGIVVLDPSQRIAAANDAFLSRAGLAREDLMGRTCRDIRALRCGLGDSPHRHASPLPHPRCPTRAVLSGSRADETVVIEVQGPHGDVRHEEIRASAVHEGGAIRYVVEVWRDITRRRQEEARLAESYRLASLGMLASGFSHEINTPLGTVLACVEGMVSHLDETRTPDHDLLRESAEIAREQVLRCRAISGQFLRLARGGGGTAGEDGGAGHISDLAPIVEAAAKLARPVAREAGVTIEVASPSGPVLVRAGEGAIQSVLLNLLVNAVEASPRGGRIVVTARPGEHKVAVEVRDHGPGIAPENLPRIVEPFFTTKPRGTGLGLFLAREFTRQWGGDLEAANDPGGGSVFRVTFPLAEAQFVSEG